MEPAYIFHSATPKRELEVKAGEDPYLARL